MGKRSILITGVHGLVGSCIYRSLIQQPEKYQIFGMDRYAHRSERAHPSEAVDIPEDQFFLNDLSGLETLEACFQGIDTVLHMAADPNGDAPWESVLKNNIEATYFVFEAAKRAGVRRVVYASSIQANLGYFRQAEPYKQIFEERYEQVPDSFRKVEATDPAWPVNLYGSSKVFGEALARMYSSTSNLSCICLRLGGVHSLDKVPSPILPNATTQKDMTRMIECCIQAPDTLKFDIFYSLSDSDYRWVDLEHAKEVLGYIPEDSIHLEE